MSLLFDKGKPEDGRRAIACYEEFLVVFTAKGYGQYRTNMAYMGRTADTYGAAQKATHLKLKRALDPNNMIAPGKSSIQLT